MKQFVEFIPIAIFVAVFFYTRDFFISTGVLMVAMFFQLVYEFATTQKIAKKNLYLFAVVMVLGSLTLLTRDKTFLLWKPTIVNWVFSLVLLVNYFFGKTNLLDKMLGEQLSLPATVWRTLSLAWSVGFFLAGLANLLVAYNFSIEVWVSYKLVGGFGITLLYMIITMTYLVKGGYLSESDTKPGPAENP